MRKKQKLFFSASCQNDFTPSKHFSLSIKTKIEKYKCNKHAECFKFSVKCTDKRYKVKIIRLRSHNYEIKSRNNEIKLEI